MSNPLDNESRTRGIAAVVPRASLPVEPFPRFPTIIQTKNPEIQKAWQGVEMEIDRWRKNLMNAILSIPMPDFSDAIKRINAALDALQQSLAAVTSIQATTNQRIENVANQLTVDLSPFLNRITGGTMIGDLILDHDPVQDLEAATRRFVLAQISSGQMVFVFNSPTNPWPLPHFKGIFPSTVRTMVQLPALSYMINLSGLVSDIDSNNSLADFGANYAGKAILGFA